MASANSGSRRLPALFRSPEWGLLASIAMVLAGIYYLDESHAFFARSSYDTVIQQVGLFGVLAVGAAVVIIAGGIDLSVGSIMAFTSVVAARLMTEWLRFGDTKGEPATWVVVVAIAATLLIGLLIGLFHALLITRFGLPPFIATLATMTGLRSLASILCHSRKIVVDFPAFRYLGRYPYVTFTTTAVVAVLASILMGLTVLGRHLFALGGNESAARLSGLKVTRLKAFAYGLSGVLAALTGVLFSGRLGQADDRLGIGYELVAITAAVVGGCSLSGGIGSVRGTFLGLVLLQILIRGTALTAGNPRLVLRVGPIRLPIGYYLSDLNSTQVEGLVLGTVIIVAVAVNQRFRPKV